MRARALPVFLALASASSAVAAVTTATDDAQASVSIAVTWDALLRGSTAAAVVTPLESNATWENGRIYTYTRVRVERAVAGELATGGEAWVRTMGGVVGKIGQIVEGEAVLSPGKPSLLFVHPGPAGAFDVTARGQGQFPIVAADSGAAKVVRSYAVGALVPPHLTVSSAATRLAADVLQGRLVDDVARAVAADWGRTHAP